jgi:hypothetical protein
MTMVDNMVITNSDVNMVNMVTIMQNIGNMVDDG